MLAFRVLQFAPSSEVLHLLLGNLKGFILELLTFYSLHSLYKKIQDFCKMKTQPQYFELTIFLTQYILQTIHSTICTINERFEHFFVLFINEFVLKDARRRFFNRNKTTQIRLI